MRTTHTEVKTNEGRRSVVVFLNFPEVRTEDEAVKLVAKLTGKVHLRDNNGNKRRGILMPTGLHRCLTSNYEAREAWGDPSSWRDQLMGRGQSSTLGYPQEMVAIFFVPSDAESFTLLVRNPDHQEGQPQLASVDLGH